MTVIEIYKSIKNRKVEKYIYRFILKMFLRLSAEVFFYYNFLFTRRKRI